MKLLLATELLGLTIFSGCGNGSSDSEDRGGGASNEGSGGGISAGALHTVGSGGSAGISVDPNGGSSSIGTGEARDDATGDLTTNLEGTPLSTFVSAANHDLHLSPSASDAIDQGTVVAESGVDLDGQTHDDGAPDLGADEYTP